MADLTWGSKMHILNTHLDYLNRANDQIKNMESERLRPLWGLDDYRILKDEAVMHDEIIENTLHDLSESFSLDEGVNPIAGGAYEYNTIMNLLRCNNEIHHLRDALYTAEARRKDLIHSFDPDKARHMPYVPILLDNGGLPKKRRR
jgi:hypothetical protein